MNHNLVLRRIRDSLPHHRPCCKKLFQDQYHLYSRSKSYAKAATGRIRFLSTSSSSSSSISNSSSSSSSSSSSYLYSEEFWESPNIIDVSPLAESIRKKVRQYTSTYYTNNNKRLRLVGILGPQSNNNDEDDDDDDGQQDLISAAELYSERIADNCYVDGIDYEIWRCPSIQDIPTNIDNANTNPNIDGIIVFYPIIQFPNENHREDPCNSTRRMPGVYYKAYDDNIRGLVHPTKDVEGLCSTTNWFHHRNRHNNNNHHTSSSTTQQQQHIVYPCTAMSVKRVLDTYHNCNNDNISNFDWKNQTVSIINRSEIVGRPLAVMLAELGATVYSIDVNSIIKFHPYNSRRSLVYHPSMIIEDCLSQSTIVVTGVPKEQYKLNLCAIQPSTTLVNVSEYQNVCPDEILERRDINFIPFVGKVTVSILEQNLITLHHENLITNSDEGI